MQNLTFKVTSRQLRGVRIWLSFVTAVFFAAIAVPLATSSISRKEIPLIAAIVGVCVLIWAVGIIPVYALFSRGFSECTPAGIRTRRIGRVREIPWQQVANIAIRARSTTTALQIITTSGVRYYIGAPVTGSVMPDPEFRSKAKQIEEYWHGVQATMGAADQW